jgi:benzoyl-CoA reductase/2-hydroxyglutaryl-CoA dehydratase subunit BcrC/BadD/HgdB
VIPRTSEQEHKLYLYLREMARTQTGGAIPQLYFYNLLHTRTPESYDYGLARTRQMVLDFEASEDALSEAIVESNRARGRVREILQKRRKGMLPGSVALDRLRGFYTEDRQAFADRAFAIDGPVEDGPRIVIRGAALNDSRLHCAVETSGGYVLSEDDWRGSRAAGDHDVRTDVDPAVAIFEKYYLDEVSPRIQPSADRDAWFQREIEQETVDGVLFYLPLQDDVMGWDYPRQAAWLQGRGVPSAVLRDVADTADLEAFVGSVRRR